MYYDMHILLILFICVPTGNSYKFQAGNRMNALLWFKHLSAACQSNRQQVCVCVCMCVCVYLFSSEGYLAQFLL